MSNQISRMDVQFSPFPDGFCPANLNDFGAQYAARLTVTPAFGFYGINIGPTSPENTDIPWFNTVDNDWYYWSSVAGAWVPVRPITITGEVQIGTVLGWDGQISLVSTFWGDRWLFANGQAISRTAYPDYFGLVGTKWGVGDGSTTFNILDARNRFWVGADADVAGQANTTVSDGSTPTIEGDYADHWHVGTPHDSAGTGEGKEAGNSYTGGAVATDSGSNDPHPMRVLPPYKALVPIVRVK